MFTGRVISRSDANGKGETFQKDFDDYGSYREFIDESPEYLPRMSLGDWWSPWSQWDPLLPDYQEIAPLHLDNSSFPKEVNLDKPVPVIAENI